MVEKSSTRFYRVEVVAPYVAGGEPERRSGEWFAWLSNADIYNVDPAHQIAVFEDRDAEMIMHDCPISRINILNLV